jgi:hypothetical protein
MREDLAEALISLRESQKYHRLQTLPLEEESDLSRRLKGLCSRLGLAPRNGLMSKRDVQNLNSPYLVKGLQNEEASIEELTLDSSSLSARGKMRMTSTATSPTDPEGFHLSAPMVLSMIGQLVVVAGHAFLGFQTKDVEVWVKDYSVQHRRPIRDPNSIWIDLRVSEIRPSSKSDHIVGFTYNATINDDAVQLKTSIYYDLSRQLNS